MAAVDILKNGYVFSDPYFIVRVEKDINNNGDVIDRIANNVSIKLNIPQGISLVSFSSDSSGVTYNQNTNIVFIPTVSSLNPITCLLMFRIDDVTTASGSQWIIRLEDVTDDPLINFTFQPIILGGLTSQDIINALEGVTGPQGEAGPANNLTIGSVTQGGTASATITGISPNQILNLVLPKGDTGTADTLSIGTVTTINPTEQASATITGTSPNKLLNLSIPKGDQGLPGAGGQMNVQSDWNQLNNTQDDYIKNKPIIPVVVPQVNSDWNSTSGVSQILNKPIVPTSTSQLINDSGFGATLTTEQISDMLSSALVHANHTNISVVYNDVANRFEFTSSGSGSDGTITNMVRSGNNLDITGTIGSFSGTLTDVFKDTVFDAQRVGNILEWYVNGSKVKDINLCCVVTKADVGLSNVPNIDATLRSNHTGTQAQSTITNLVTDLSNKQEILVSGTNIKTVNSQSLLGSGNINIVPAADFLWLQSGSVPTQTLGVGTVIDVPFYILTDGSTVLESQASTFPPYNFSTISSNQNGYRVKCELNMNFKVSTDFECFIEIRKGSSGSVSFLRHHGYADKQNIIAWSSITTLDIINSELSVKFRLGGSTILGTYTVDFWDNSFLVYKF